MEVKELKVYTYVIYFYYTLFYFNDNIDLILFYVIGAKEVKG